HSGGALRVAVGIMDPNSDYVMVVDADARNAPRDSRACHTYCDEKRNGNGNGNGHHKQDEDILSERLAYLDPEMRAQVAAAKAAAKANGNGKPHQRPQVGPVQSYQWHVLNKAESWLTEAVRSEYAGSYMIERPFQEHLGSLKMVAGTAYMIRADLLREVGWGTSLTEDWELTLKLYARGYKVAYTPWAETPAECVSTFSRLARQRMRWAEGHTHNVRKWFWPILLSPFVSPLEKLEFAFDATYYLQAALFVVGSASWAISELVFQTHVPGWTAVLGWSLLFSNIFALPLMNLGGLILEEAP